MTIEDLIIELASIKAQYGAGIRVENIFGEPIHCARIEDGVVIID